MNTGPTFPSLALRALRRRPDRACFVEGGAEVSGGAASDFIGRVQTVLAAQGLGAGDRIALLSPNRWEAWCVGVAAQALGAATTWLHPLGAAEAHRFQIEDSGAKHLVVDAASYGARGAELAASLPGLNLLTVGAHEAGLDLIRAAEEAGSRTARDVSKPEDLAALNYTGGTTGRPKGVMRASGGLAQMAVTVMAEFEWAARPRFLAVAPISHVAGTNVVPVLLRGGSVHLLGRFEPEELLRAIEAARITTTLMVPSMIYRLLDHPRLGEFDLSSLDLLLYGASPMAPTRLAEGLERIGPVFSQLYGQSECYPIASLPREDHDPARPELLAACGFPAAASEVALLDGDGNEVPVGAAGEICVRSPCVMQGYWRQPEQTADAFAGGWLHTGDIATRDEVGRLTIVDRKKDMVVSGGFNVYPREVEDVLATHPAVAMAAVIGVPDPQWGEAVKAVVVLRDGQRATATELVELVRARKGRLHAPKQVEFAESLPLTPLGKLDKKALRARHWEGEGRGVA
ncbi:AMP-binding protein [Sabulicella rubraurantiaca]|uniref:AMP-binding protein n=1 Tax=Sabulicella rubraurantiaca TaxID=2811429 RepID=UPI001A96BAE4|nr:AMP-binding protein [Sabulicella rubraurantiaca]